MRLETFVLACLLALPAAADFDPSQHPARPVPADRWGTLSPVIFTNCRQIQQTSPCVLWTDATSTSPLTEPGDRLYFFDIATAGGFIFTASGQGMKIFDVSTPATPVVFRYVDASFEIKEGQTPEDAGKWGFSDKNHFMTSIAVVPGRHDLVATGNEEFGFIAWDTTDKRRVTYRYQDARTFVRDVHVATIGGRDFAFSFDNTASIRVYDLDAIAALSKCYEQDDVCPGAYKGRLAKGQAKGGAVGGANDYLVHRDFLTLKIYDVGDVVNARQRMIRRSLIRKADMPPVVLEAALSSITHLGEVAMWQDGDRYWLALAVGTASGGETWVYDVSGITEGRCSLPDPVVYQTPDSSGRVPPLNLDISFDGAGRPYLYVGTSAGASMCVPQREYLFDASDPAAMVELTPRVPGKPYWGWYDEPCAGYNGVAPRHAVMVGSVLWRAAYTMADGHHVDTSPDIPDTGTVIFSDGFESGDTGGWE